MPDESNEIKCFFCQKPTDDEHYCYGCSIYICDECTDEENDPWGDHEPSDHIVAEEYDADGTA